MQVAGAGLSSASGESGTPATFNGSWTPAGPPPLRRPRDPSLSTARAAAVVVLVLVVLVLPQVVLVLGVEA